VRLQVRTGRRRCGFYSPLQAGVLDGNGPPRRLIFRDIFPNLSRVRVIHLDIDNRESAYHSLIHTQSALAFRRRKHRASTFGIR
jgi:hypothetical protein